MPRASRISSTSPGSNAALRYAARRSGVSSSSDASKRVDSICCLLLSGQLSRPPNVTCLRTLVACTQQNHDSCPVIDEINPVARAIVDPADRRYRCRLCVQRRRSDGAGRPCERLCCHGPERAALLCCRHARRNRPSTALHESRRRQTASQDRFHSRRSTTVVAGASRKARLRSNSRHESRFNRRPPARLLTAAGPSPRLVGADPIPADLWPASLLRLPATAIQTALASSCWSFSTLPPSARSGSPGRALFCALSRKRRPHGCRLSLKRRGVSGLGPAARRRRWRRKGPAPSCPSVERRSGRCRWR